MPSDFTPFDATPEDLEARQVLRDGVPETMRASLLTWLRDRVVVEGSARVGLLRDIENNCDLTLGVGALGYLDGIAATRILSRLNGRQVLSVAHYLLYTLPNYQNAAYGRESLERLLADGRSKWTVGKTATEHWGLVARVPAGVQVAAEALFTIDGSAGQLLATAWGEVHDLHPRDSSGYAYAVRAVEAASLPALGVTGDTATLGNAIRAIERKDATWRLPFKREHTEYPSKDVLLGMLKSLYRGQRDRHGSEAYSDVTHDEALAAVYMAVTLVGLFSGGLVQERDPSAFT